MIRNNFDLILPFIQEEEDGYYTVEIMVRKKDIKKEKSTRLIKRLRIESKQQLIDDMPLIIGLCEYFGGRAYIDLNHKSYRKTAYQTLNRIAGYLEHHDYKAVSKAYSRSAGYIRRGIWMIDVDFDDKQLEIVQESPEQHVPREHFITTIPSRGEMNYTILFTAHHIIEWADKVSPHTITKNAIVNLYIA